MISINVELRLGDPWAKESGKKNVGSSRSREKMFLSNKIIRRLRNNAFPWFWILLSSGWRKKMRKKSYYWFLWIELVASSRIQQLACGEHDDAESQKSFKLLKLPHVPNPPTYINTSSLNKLLRNSFSFNPKHKQLSTAYVDLHKEQ